MFVSDNGFDCDNLFLCWMTVLHYGLTSGSAITFLSTPTLTYNDHGTYAGRIIYDIGFYILINICIVNITIGLLATAFGNLKQEEDERKLTLETECFICSQDQSAFIKKNYSFEQHVQNDHNMWNYVFFFLYLREKPAIEFTAQESYVSSLVNNRNITFFPIQQSGDATEVDVVQRLETIEIKLEKITKMLKSLKPPKTQQTDTEK